MWYKTNDNKMINLNKIRISFKRYLYETKN
jgi:hypothetical protein